MVSAHKWLSVIVFGRYEELLDTPEWRSEREFAWKVLATIPDVVGTWLREDHRPRDRVYTGTGLLPH